MREGALPAVSVLLVEDNPGDARLLRLALAEAGRFDVVHCPTLAEGIAQTAASGDEKAVVFDVVLLDLSLPDCRGLETVRRMHEAAADRPIVILTGLDDEETALEALRVGAQDYLVKGRYDGELLARAVRHAIERKRIVMELDRLNRFKNQLLGMAAHDLRNPLAVVLACSELLLDGEGTAMPAGKQRDFHLRIKTNAEFMLRLIDDLLDVSRIESGRLELQLERTELGPMIARNLEFNAVLARRKGIELACRHCAAVPVMADTRRLEQVLNNLISNAIKFSASGARVEVTVSRESGAAVVAVADHGQGIPPDELDLLFKPFSRTSTRSTAGEKSTGLGLAIARRIVEAHKGRIWAESRLGAGSVFRFSLPAADRQESGT